MVSSNHPSKLSSSSSSLPSSQSPGPPPHGTSTITGGENLFPPAKLEENHSRPMGVGSSSGIQVRANEPAAAVAHTVSRDIQEVCRPDFGRDRIYVGQEGHTVHSTRPNRRFLFLYLPCPHKRRKIQASCEPSSVEQMHPVQAFQNGRNPHSEGPLKGDYMVRIDIKDVYFAVPICTKHCKYLRFHWRGQTYEFTCLPFGLACNASCLHEGDEAGCGVHQEQGSAVCGIHRRFSARASEETGSDRADSSDPELVGSSGIPGKLFQVSSATISKNRIPRIHDRLLDRGAQSPEGEGGSDQIRGNSPDGPGLGLGKRACSADRQDVSSHSGSLSSPTSLQEPSGTQTQGTSSIQIRWNHKSVSRCKERSPLVGQQFEGLEWPYNDKGQPTVDNRNRCILEWMGSVLPRRSNSRMLEQRRTEPAYQRFGDASRFLCLKSIPEGQRRSLSPDPIGHVGSSPYQQNGGDEISKASGGDKENVCLVFAEVDQVASSTSPRKTEHHSRFLVQAFERQNRLGPQCQHFQSHQSHMGSTTGGPVCNSFFCSAKEIFQLEGGSRGRGNRHPFSELVHDTGICTPSMVPNCKGTDEGSEGRSNGHSGRSALEDPTLVPFPPEHAGGSTNSITRHPRSDHSFPELRLASVGNSAPAGHMEGLRRHFRSKEIPNNAIEPGEAKPSLTITLPERNGKDGASKEVRIPLQQMCPLS